MRLVTFDGLAQHRVDVVFRFRGQGYHLQAKVGLCSLSLTPRMCLTACNDGSENNTEIVVEKKSESKEYDEFVEDLPPNEPRYA